MKNILIIGMLVILLVLVIYLFTDVKNNSNENLSQSKNDEIMDNNIDVPKEEQYYLICEVIEVDNDSIVVKPIVYNDEINNIDKIQINTSNYNSKFSVGNKLKITYNGIITKSYPAQITVDKIENYE